MCIVWHQLQYSGPSVVAHWHSSDMKDMNLKFNQWKVFGAGIFSTAVLTLLTPLAAEGGVYVLMAVRVVEGIFEGVTFPCIHAVWSKWAPPHERSRSKIKKTRFHDFPLYWYCLSVATIAFAGAYAGTVVAMPLSSILATAWGWESLFYFFGKCGIELFANFICSRLYRHYKCRIKHLSLHIQIKA